MTVIRRYEVRCPACKGTGEYLNGSDEVRCDACGGCGEVVPSTTYRGAVAALKRYGWHDIACPAIRTYDEGPCECGWNDTLATYGGQ